MRDLNKKLIFAGLIFLLAFIVLIWPSSKDSLPSGPISQARERLESGKAGSEIIFLEREEEPKSLAGHFRGRVDIDSFELVGKSFLSRAAVALIKANLERDLGQGFYVDFYLEEDGSWLMDLGESFSSYQITTLVSTTEDRVDFKEGLLDARREFYIPDLKDSLYLKLRGHVLDYVGGTLILEGENDIMKLSVVGSFKLDRIP